MCFGPLLMKVTQYVSNLVKKRFQKNVIEQTKYAENGQKILKVKLFFTSFSVVLMCSHCKVASLTIRR